MTDSSILWTKKSPYASECKTAISAVLGAADLCRAVQATIAPDTMEKKDRSPVTLADFGSQALVCSALERSFPNDPIIAEEDAAALREPAGAELLAKLVGQLRQIRPDADAQKACDWIDLGRSKDYTDRFWTLDPIDGTKGFLRREQYAIALALVVEGQIQVAALACPNLGTAPGSAVGRGAVFAAIRGVGTYDLPIQKSASAIRLQVSAEAAPSRIRFCESVEAAHSSHADAAAIGKFLGIAAEPVRLDSQTKYGVVARGGAEAYLRLPRSKTYREKIWDHAGGALIVTEAGGRVTDISGNPLDFRHGTVLAENSGVIVSNGHVHDHILRAIDELGIDKSP